MTDLLLVSLGTTQGLRVADDSFAEAVRDAGASVAVARVRMGSLRAVHRGGAAAYPLVDLAQALAARRAAAGAARRHRPRAVVFSTTTSALLAPPLDAPFAVRLDAPAAVNRPGARNSIQHALERRRLARAKLVLPWSRAAAAALPAGSAETVVVPPPVGPSGPIESEREPLAVAYAPGPREKGLDLLCAAWGRASTQGVRLAVFGVDAARAARFLERRGVAQPPGVEWRGMTDPAEFRAALRRARVFVSASAWEDFGLVALEALADGALLVCAPAGGTFEELTVARELEPRIVAPERTPDALAACLSEALALPGDAVAAYRRDAADRLDEYRPQAVAETVARRVIPRLLD